MPSLPAARARSASAARSTSKGLLPAFGVPAHGHPGVLEERRRAGVGPVHGGAGARQAGAAERVEEQQDQRVPVAAAARPLRDGERVRRVPCRAARARPGPRRRVPRDRAARATAPGPSPACRGSSPATPRAAGRGSPRATRTCPARAVTPASRSRGGIEPAHDDVGRLGRALERHAEAEVVVHRPPARVEQLHARARVGDGDELAEHARAALPGPPLPRLAQSRADAAPRRAGVHGDEQVVAEQARVAPRAFRPPRRARRPWRGRSPRPPTPRGGPRRAPARARGRRARGRAAARRPRGRRRRWGGAGCGRRAGGRTCRVDTYRRAGCRASRLGKCDCAAWHPRQRPEADAAGST